MKNKFEIPPKSVGARVRLATFADSDRERFLAGEKCIPLRKTAWIKNLVLDQGLNILAGGVGYGNCFTRLSVGSGTNPNEFNFSAAAIFTQVSTTITASSAVFTSAMIGGIFKYGGTGVSSGAEQYITAVSGGGTTATVAGAGMTVATPTAGAVWQVQATALQTPLSGGTSTTCVSGMNSSTFSGTTGTFLRTFQFASPGSTWSVNEVGYDGGGSLVGRIVLPSTVTVTTSEFLVAQLELVVTQTPNTPTAVGNVGTGFNTAGIAMQQVWDCRGVNSAGATVNLNSTNHGSASTLAFCCDGAPGILAFITGTATSANSSILNSNQADLSPAPSYAALPTHTTISNSGQPVGVGVGLANPFNFTTAGETINGISFGSGGGVPTSCGYILNLTTPFVMPVGTFSGTWFQQWQFSRQLVN